MKFKVKLEILIALLCMVIGAGVYFANETNAQGKTYYTGDRGPAGGWIFYDKGSYSGGWRYLEASPEKNGIYEWGCYRESIPGARGTAIGTGKSNTQAIIRSCGEADIAAKICTAYRGGGVSDWFLPSKDELNLMYTKLYKFGIGGFPDDVYWSSSEAFDTNAWCQSFVSSNQGRDSKQYNCRVRAVRAF